MSSIDPARARDPHIRWKFFRDVLVFQLKLLLGNLQTLVLVPVSLGAAAIDLIFNGEREGRLFYKVLEWGRKTDEGIDIYSPIGGYRATCDEHGNPAQNNFSLDAVLARVETVIAREYEKGGTAANLKSAVDRTIDEIQAQGVKGKGKFSEVVQRATRNRGQKSE